MHTAEPFRYTTNFCDLAFLSIDNSDCDTSFKMADIETNAPARPLPFVHSPLPDSETHIRLLEVLQGNFEQHVVCVMSTWPLDSAPPYSAISYTWGDPALTANITIDGRDMVVGQNCEYALQQTFAIKKKEKRVWVDAVCIDQTNIKERGHQVAIMGKVYSKAAQVFACVGPHADDSEFLRVMCRKKEKLLTDIISAVRWGSWDAWLDFPDGGVRLGTRCLLSMSRSTEVKLKKALVAFLKRPYFSRIWILQELSMGTNVVVCCGSTLILASHILALDALLRCDDHIHIGYERERYDIVKVKYMKAVRSISRSCDSIVCRKDNNAILEAYGKIKPRRGCLVLAARGLGHRRPDFYHVMNHINEFECADARDKLYGILNLVDWSSGSTPTPDYQKSTYDVAVDALSSIKVRSFLGRRALSWAQHIATIFEISPMDVAIKDRLRMRRNNALSSKPSVPNSRRPQFLEYYWSGDPIIDRSDQTPSRSSKGLYYSTSKTQDGIVELRHGNEMPCLLAPPQTAAGDWFLKMWRDGEAEHWGSTGMIVRNSGSSQYTIVGLARQTEHFVMVDEIKRKAFDVRWDPGDLLLLHLAAMEPDKLDIEELHSIKICGAKDSSFAVLYEYPAPMSY
jgi:hypothetical protein